MKKSILIKSWQQKIRRLGCLMCPVLIVGYCFSARQTKAQNLVPPGRWGMATFGIPHSVELQQSGQGLVLVGGTEFTFDQEGVTFGMDGTYRQDNGQSGSYIPDAYGGIRSNIGFSQLAASRDIVAGVSDNPSSDLHLSLILREPDTLALADLAGDWSYERIETPSAMTYSSAGGLSGGALFNAASGDVQIQADGTVPGIGSVSISGKTVQLHAGVSVDTMIINRNKDVMVRLKKIQNDAGEFSNVLTVIVKKPASLAAQDIAGTWRYFQMDLPLQMSLAGGGQSISGGNNFEIEGSGQVFTLNPSGSVTISPDGTTIPWSFSNGKFQTPRGMASINASKTLIVQAHQDQDVKILTLFVRTLRYLSDTGLSAHREADGSLTFTWPDRQEGFGLDQAGLLNGPWQRVPQAPIRSNHFFSINLKAARPDKSFYRLSQL